MRRVLGIIALVASSKLCAGARADALAELRAEAFLVGSAKSFELGFRQLKKLTQLGLELESSGSLKVRSAKDVTWTVEKPAWLKVDIAGTKLRLYQDPKNPTQVQELDAAAQRSESMAAWMSLLSLDEKVVRESFDTEKLGPHLYRLRSRSNTGAVSAIVVKAQNQGFFGSFEIQERSGDTLKISFSPPQQK